jgi:hypothetical protein
MTWMFTKGGQRMSCEVREAMLWYELIITSPDGAVRVERPALTLSKTHEQT